MLLATIYRRLNPDGWLETLPAQSGALDRAFGRPLRRRVHLPQARRTLLDILFGRPAAPEPIEVVRKRVPPPLTGAATDFATECAVTSFLGEARVRARDEVSRHVDSLPRGQERAAKFPTLTAAHEARTARPPASRCLTSTTAVGSSGR